MDQADGGTRPYALKAGEGWTYRLFGVDFIVKAGEIPRGNGAAFMEYVTRKGEEPGEHTHPGEDEIFYVLEGKITFLCGGERFDLEQGGFIFLPHGIPHDYTIPGEDPVRLLIVTAPVREGPGGGWGGFVSDLELGQGELVASPSHLNS
jgi:quercetin dioxygenase-like cupin family protein